MMNLMGASSSRTGTDFPKVKEILERNYECMRISCAHVGGIWNAGEERYYSDTLACTGSFVRNNRFILGIALSTAGALLVCFILMCALPNCCNKRGKEKVARESMDGVKEEPLPTLS